VFIGDGVGVARGVGVGCALASRSPANIRWNDMAKIVRHTPAIIIIIRILKAANLVLRFARLGDADLVVWSSGLRCVSAVDGRRLKGFSLDACGRLVGLPVGRGCFAGSPGAGRRKGGSPGPGGRGAGRLSACDG